MLSLDAGELYPFFSMLPPFVGVGLRADWPCELPCPHPASRAVVPQQGGLFPDRLCIRCHSSRGCIPCSCPPLCAPAVCGTLEGRKHCCPPPLFASYVRGGVGGCPKACSRGDGVEVVHLIVVLFCFVLELLFFCCPVVIDLLP